MNVVCDDHAVDQHRIDADADHDEKALKCQSEQAFQIVRADAAPFAVLMVAMGIGAMLTVQ